MLNNNNAPQYQFTAEPVRFVKGQNTKYFGCSKVGTYHVRFVSPPLKFYHHYNPTGRKICPKTLGLKTPPGEDAQGNIIPPQGIFFDIDPATGALIPYSADKMFCPVCEAAEPVRKRYAINVIDLDEKARYDKQGVPFLARIMEFPKQIYDHLVNYANTHRVQPFDLVNGSNFTIEAYYPDDKLNPAPRDIVYKVLPDGPPGSAPLTQHEINMMISGTIKVYNLVDEYHPLKQKRQSVFPQPDTVTTVPSEKDNRGFYQPAGPQATYTPAPQQAPPSHLAAAPNATVYAQPVQSQSPAFVTGMTTVTQTTAPVDNTVQWQAPPVEPVQYQQPQVAPQPQPVPQAQVVPQPQYAPAPAPQPQVAPAPQPQYAAPAPQPQVAPQPQYAPAPQQAPQYAAPSPQQPVQQQPQYAPAPQQAPQYAVPQQPVQQQPQYAPAPQQAPNMAAGDDPSVELEGLLNGLLANQ